jgi:predicted secreted protein
VRRILATAVLAVVLVGSLVSCGSDNGGDDAAGSDGSGNGAQMLVFQDEATPIAVVPGQEFAIRLESNSTTGYEWTMTEAPNAELVEVLEGEGMTEESQNTSGLVGVPGSTTFVFLAKASGSTPVAFTYARAFDPSDNPTAAAFTINVS